MALAVTVLLWLACSSAEGLQQGEDSLSQSAANTTLGTSSTWPSFATLAALKTSPWGRYFKGVYGELPRQFPVSTENFWILFDEVLLESKVIAPTSSGSCPTANPPQGQRYIINNMYQPRMTSWIWHPYPYHALSTNSWAEVTHKANPDEHFGAWFVYAPGSGIYFNTGKTISFQEHGDAIMHFGVKREDLKDTLSKAAAAQGYDSIQFLGRVDHVKYQCDTLNTGNPGLAYMGLEILGVKLVGTFACGGSSSQSVIRAGWQASRACLCDNTDMFLNCQTGVRDNAEYLV